MRLTGEGAFFKQVAIGVMRRVCMIGGHGRIYNLDFSFASLVIFESLALLSPCIH